MVSFGQLRDARLEPLADSVPTWTRLVAKLEAAEDDYRGKFLGPLRNSGWQGKAARVAFGVLVPFQQYLRVSVTEASAVASVLYSGHAKFKAAQDKLLAAIDEAAGLRLAVGDDGSLRLPPMTAADQKDPDGYWDENSESLRNQARVITQQYGQVGLVGGRPPG